MAHVVRHRPVDRIVRPLEEFARIEASGGLVLLACTVLALAWANSPWSASYERLWAVQITLAAGPLTIAKPALLWINDGLMAIFFFVVGLEIKREVIVGELATLRQAALPLVAAIGGMAVPAAIYVAITAGTSGANGWGIPMATDIAFALGIVALLGPRVPASLKVFLTALAIVDDLGAILVIAVFYSEKLALGAIAVAALCAVLLAVANRLGIRHPLVYIALGIPLWIAVLKSGIHATVAGVILALAVPARTRIEPATFLRRARALLDRFEAAGSAGESVLTNETRLAAVEAVRSECERVETPLQRIEHALHPWVTFLIMPVFALANAGVAIAGDALGAFDPRLALGVLLGLLVGKPAGIVGASWLAERLGLARRATGIRWRHIVGVATLAGVGFTMSLFIAALAFPDAPRLASAKIGVLAGSILAGSLGWIVLRSATTAPPAPAAVAE